MSVEKLEKPDNQKSEQDKVEKGLEGVVALESAISSIIGSTLTYRGIEIDELAEKANFEEVIYLLWFGKLPNRQQLDELSATLRENAHIPEPVMNLIKSFPRDIVPMDGLRTAVSMLAHFDPEVKVKADDYNANLRKAVRITAAFPIIVTAIERVKNGLEPVMPRQDLSLSGNFVYMLDGKEPEEIAIKALDTALVLHADHELNASTFSARGTSSTLSDLHSAIVSAIGTLKGPLHGGANEAVMKMLLSIDDPTHVEDWIKNALVRKEKIMGFGHRVYKNGDPRAKHLRRMSEEVGKLKGDTRWIDMSIVIDDVVTRERGLLPNVDFYSASLYHVLGLPIEAFTPVFACSRVSGWIAHCFEQYADNRLIRPRAHYNGPVNQHYIPIEERV
jgi:citrate synthase